MTTDYIQLYNQFAHSSTEAVIPYKKSYKEIAGSVTAAILLQQIVFYDIHYAHGRPFYKFKQPCKHPDYRTGDSWCEVLGFSRAEFDTAISKIGQKVKGGEVDFSNESALVFYWTTMDRRTYYQVNPLALGKATIQLYEKWKSSGRYSDNPALDQYTESTSILPEEYIGDSAQSGSKSPTQDPIEREDQLASIMATLSSVCKETYYHGNHQAFEDVAFLVLDEWQSSSDKIREFGRTWESHFKQYGKAGKVYAGKPALKSFVTNFPDFLSGLWPQVPETKTGKNGRAPAPQTAVQQAPLFVNGQMRK